jgi:hypothetical protein
MIFLRKVVFGLICSLPLANIVYARPVIESSKNPDKDLWRYEAPGIAWCNYTTMYEHHKNIGTADLGFNIDDFVNSEMGAGMIANLKNHLLYPDEMAPEILQYWEKMGIRKELFNADNMAIKYAVFSQSRDRNALV